MSDINLEERAREIAEEKAGFFIHFSIYSIVVLGLAGLNFYNNPDQLWFIWTALGWGIGIIIHFTAVFVTPNFVNGYIANQTAKELEKLKQREGN